MDTTRCMIIGAGNIGLQLLQMLSRDLKVCVLDSSEESLERARQIRSEDLETFAGDATSRFFLEKAGVADVDTVIITTSAEPVNIEVARILYEHFDIPRVLAIGITPEGIRQLAAYECEVEGIFKVSAIGLRNRLEQRTKTVHGIGLEKNEILEVEVHPHSRLANKRLGSLRPRSWRAGIIYRDGNIIVPFGSTVFKPRDRVVLLGEPQVVRTVADLLTFRFARFPLEYGDTLVVWLTPESAANVLAEGTYLLDVFPLDKTLFLLSREDEAMRTAVETLVAERRSLTCSIVDAQGAAAETCLPDAVREAACRPGLVVLPYQLGKGAGLTWSKAALRKLSQATTAPLLLAAGTHPYAKVSVPCLDADSTQQALETTLEMSLEIKYSIEALLVDVSPYIGDAEDEAAFATMEKTIADLSLAYKRQVKSRVLEGNPIESIAAALKESNLAVQYVDGWSDSGFWRGLLRPDPAWEVIRRAPLSTLLIPSIEASV